MMVQGPAPQNRQTLCDRIPAMKPAFALHPHPLTPGSFIDGVTVMVDFLADMAQALRTQSRGAVNIDRLDSRPADQRYAQMSCGARHASLLYSRVGGSGL